MARRGLTVASFSALPMQEQIDYLAYEMHIRNVADEVMDALGKKPDFSYSSAYVALLLARI